MMRLCSQQLSRYNTEKRSLNNHTYVFKFLLVMVCCFLFKPLYADSFRVGAMAGFANASTKTDETSLSEGPFGGASFIEYALDDRRTIGVEHLRSADLEAVSTAVSFTGIYGKWYPYTPQPQYVPSEKDLTVSSLVLVDLSPYVSTGLGFFQSNIPGVFIGEEDANAAGLYFSLKGGVEYPIWRGYGLRLEAGGAFSFGGSGTSNMPYLMLGFYAFL
ncbi:MAG: hypothetical protein MK008_12815 [Bdellovibrionales bacterium]|nr:hypothetical protein [Bdellovibrionales bacterium]